MKTAFVTVRDTPAYPFKEILRGLERAGYRASPINSVMTSLQDGDVVVMWTPWAFTRNGMMFKLFPQRCVVLENGYLPLDHLGHKHWTLGLGGFNGIGTHGPTGNPRDRWDKLGLAILDLLPVREYGLVVGQAEADDPRWSSPGGWAAEAVERMKKEGHKDVRFRPKPGRPYTHRNVQAPILEGSVDMVLAGAGHVVGWNSKLLVESVRRGIPTDYEAKNCVLSTYSSVTREQFFYDLAYSQWTSEELESGEPFVRILSCLG